MQDYICEACGKSAHSAGSARLCVHCGGILTREQKSARKAETGVIEQPDLLQAGSAS